MDPKDLKVKILGIVATPIKGGNIEYIVREALKTADGEGNVETEFIHLDDYRIEYCIGCDGCMKRTNKIMQETGMVIPLPVKEYNCGIKDDMGIIHKKLVECDGAIFGTPVYMLGVPSQFMTFIDRCRTFAHDFRLWGKVAGTITVAHFRNCGQDTTLDMMDRSLLPLGFSIACIGATTVSTKDGTGIPIKETRFAVEKDMMGMIMVNMVAQRVTRMAMLLKAGEKALES